MMQMGLFLSIVRYMEMEQHIWEDHGELMLGFFSTITICPILLTLLVGIHGILLDTSENIMLHYFHFTCMLWICDFDINVYFCRDRIQFSEYLNYGYGATTNYRVKWTKNLDMNTINTMASLSFIDNDGWLQNQQF